MSYKLLSAITLGTALPLLSMTNVWAGMEVNYQVDSQPYQGYYAAAIQADKSEKAPFILLIHDWDGLTDYEKKRADMLAEQGYNVLAADMFGQGIRPTKMEDKKAQTEILYKDRNKMRRVLAGALNQGQQLGNDVHAGVTMGYCFGGSVALELARTGFNQKAFVPFHGGLATPTDQSYEKTKGEIMVFHGSADDSVPLEDFTSLGKTLEESKIAHEMITYSGAPHAFTVFDSDRYDERADMRSWNRYLDILDNLYPERR